MQTNPDVIGDYVAVVTNNGSPSERAKETSPTRPTPITGSTVSANVARIKRALDAGEDIMVNGTKWSPGDAVSGSAAVPMSLSAFVAETMPDASMAFDLVHDRLSEIESDEGKARAQIEDANQRLDAAEKRRTDVMDIVARILPDGVTLDTVNAGYAEYVEAFNAEDASTEDAPEPDAEPDATA